MREASSWRRGAALAVLLLVASAANAQAADQPPSPPPAAPGLAVTPAPPAAPTLQPPPVVPVGALPPEAPNDVQASSQYDQAIRAETLHKWLEARHLAEQVLSLSPAGRYEPATRRLLTRLALEEASVDGAARASHYAGRSRAAGRARFVVSATIQGLIAGLLMGAGASVDSENSAAAIAGGGLLGIVLGLVPALAVGDAVADPAFESHLTLGGFAGAGIAGALIGITQPSGNAPEMGVALGIVLGALTGVVVAANTDLTEGDGEAGTALLLHGVTEVLLIVGAAISATGANVDTPTISAIGLLSGTAGLIAGELLNRELHWSDLRWALITTGGFLGLGVGLLLNLLVTNGNGDATSYALVGAAGELIALAATAWGTSGLPPEAPRGVDPEASPAPPPTAPSSSIPPSLRGPRVVALSIPLLRF